MCARFIATSLLKTFALPGSKKLPREFHRLLHETCKQHLQKALFICHAVAPPHLRADHEQALLHQADAPHALGLDGGHTFMKRAYANSESKGTPCDCSARRAIAMSTPT